MYKKGGARAKLFLILTLSYVFDDLVTVAVVGSWTVLSIIVRQENVWKHPGHQVVDFYRVTRQ